MNQKSRPFFTGLMWVHYIYLGIIPLIGVFAIIARGHAWGPLITFGWIPVVIYISLHASSYRLSTSIISAVFSAGIVPSLTLLSTVYFEKDILFYFMQEMTLEVAAVFVSITLAMVLTRPNGWWGVGVMTFLGIPAVSVLGYPLIREYMEIGGWSFVFLGATFLFALVSQTQMFYSLAKRFNASGKAQRTLRKYGVGRSVSPVTNTDHAAMQWILGSLFVWAGLMTIAAIFFPY